MYPVWYIEQKLFHKEVQWLFIHMLIKESDSVENAEFDHFC